MNPPDLLRKAVRHFRSRRMRLFETVFAITPDTRVLDVGGSPSIWEFLTVQPHLTIVNFPTALETGAKSVECVAGDGRLLPFQDAAFDIAFSNSVIEHVGNRVNQQRFAEEIARVARSYWVQTPNRGFPIELHLMLPFIHYLPKAWQRAIIERFTVWELLVRPNEAQRSFYVEHFLNDVKLLDKSNLQRLFPDAKILSERVLGVAKSLIAIRTG
ncbi:MAG: methyltransferase domain-containing protein [Bryobacteraceae bacterium]